MPDPDQPLGLPRGTVRAYLALMIVGAFLAAHLVASGYLLWSGNVEAGLAVLGALAIQSGVASGFYFAKTDA